jgi:chromosome segregation ATPase
LERENTQLSATLKAGDSESQQLRLQIASMSQREALFCQSESRHAKIQSEFVELRAREQTLALSLKEAERERKIACNQLSQFKQQTSTATESARHASILMQAMEADLSSAERARQNLQASLTACALERDELQQQLRRAQQELEVSRCSDARKSVQIDLLAKNLADNQESQSRSDSVVLQLRQELLRQQQFTEDFRSQMQIAQSLVLAKEEEYTSMLSMQKDENVALRSQIESSQALLTQQQKELSELISVRNAAQSKCKELQSSIESLENSRADLCDSLQAQINANARCSAEIRDLRTALENQSSKQRENFDKELNLCRQEIVDLQSQLQSEQQQSAACNAICSSQQQSIHELSKKLELSATERAAVAMQLDSLRVRAQKEEAAYSRLNQDSKSQISQLSSDLMHSHSKMNELQTALSNMTSRCNQISGELSKATSDLEFKDSELKATIKQARAKSLQQEELYSQLQDQHVCLQHDFSETSARLQQQLLGCQQNAASKASRILALEDALTGKKKRQKLLRKLAHVTLHFQFCEKPLRTPGLQYRCSKAN